MAHIAMNRRIGSRTPVRIPVTLRTEARGRFRGARKTDAVITNLSVTGLEVDCQAIPGVALRDRLVIEAEKGTATVEVRRIETIAYSRVHYGLLFLEMDATFGLAMNRIATGMGKTDLDWRWNTAH